MRETAAGRVLVGSGTHAGEAMPCGMADGRWWQGGGLGCGVPGVRPCACGVRVPGRLGGCCRYIPRVSNGPLVGRIVSGSDGAPRVILKTRPKPTVFRVSEAKKTVGEKQESKPIPADSKLADIHPETDSLPSLLFNIIANTDCFFSKLTCVLMTCMDG